LLVDFAGFATDPKGPKDVQRDGGFDPRASIAPGALRSVDRVGIDRLKATPPTIGCVVWTVGELAPNA